MISDVKDVFHAFFNKTIGLYEALGKLETCPTVSQDQGRVLLVTPLGDTHLFGAIIPYLFLTKLGYQCELAIQVTEESLNSAIGTFQPDMILMTCLLDTSRKAIVSLLTSIPAPCPPVILGGFGLNEAWVRDQIVSRYEGDIFYASRSWDAINHVRHVSELSPLDYLPTAFDETAEEAILEHPPLPPYKHAITDFSERRDATVSLREIWDTWIPSRSLYTLHLGYKGNFEKGLALQDPLAVAMKMRVESLQADILSNHWLTPKALRQWRPCYSQGTTIVFETHRGTLVIPFPLQRSGLSLAHYVGPEQDVMGFLTCTVGETHAVIRRLIESNRYQDALLFHALSVQSAEGLCEYHHYQMRLESGLNEPLPDYKAMQNASYSGRRYSFGYAACPDLQGQRFFFDILPGYSIGVSLTPLCMMAPEASVNAMVFLHPEAHY